MNKIVKLIQKLLQEKYNLTQSCILFQTLNKMSFNSFMTEAVII